MWVQASRGETWHYCSTEDRYRPLCGIKPKVTSTWMEKAKVPTDQSRAICADCRYKSHVYYLERAIDEVLENCPNAKKRIWRTRLRFEQLDTLDWFQVEVEFGIEIKDRWRRLFDKAHIFNPQQIAQKHAEDTRKQHLADALNKIEEARNQQGADERWRRKNLRVPTRSTQFTPRIDGQKRNYPRMNHDDYSEDAQS